MSDHDSRNGAAGAACGPPSMPCDAAHLSRPGAASGPPGARIDGVTWRDLQAELQADAARRPPMTAEQAERDRQADRAELAELGDAACGCLTGVQTDGPCGCLRPDPGPPIYIDAVTWRDLRADLLAAAAS